MGTEKFKKFWVVEVNNYICDAAYDGKTLKGKHRIPSFRKFHFIKEWGELEYFTKRKEITNEELVKVFLAI
jgi:ATP-dependent DNA ligase